MAIQTTSITRERFVSDFQRPLYHYLPPAHWMNDPNGVIQWNGQYHLFYQYNPIAPVWGGIHWGHAVSNDLVHWEDLPLALEPTTDGPDAMGCFSGCAVDNDGIPTIIYTGALGDSHEIQSQCVATSDDDLLTWKKDPRNPVLTYIPEAMDQHENFRDPFVWREDDGWYMVLGSQFKDVGGAALLYRSDNLISWEYLHPLLIGDITRNGVVWECPNFFPLDDKWVLIVSAHTGGVTGTVFYFVGTYENHQFTPEHEGVVDFGHLYAPLTMLDDQNRRLMFGWIRETRTIGEMRQAGWAGVQCIPRVLALDSARRLTTTPIPELDTLRGSSYHIESQDLDGETPLEIKDWSCDIEAEFELDSRGVCAMTVAYSSDARERTDVIYNAKHRQLTVRTTTIGMGAMQITHSREIFHPLEDNERLKLRLLLDGSVLEVIANDRTSVTHRMYPINMESCGMSLWGEAARVVSLDIWDMPSIWE